MIYGCPLTLLLALNLEKLWKLKARVTEWKRQSRQAGWNMHWWRWTATSGSSFLTIASLRLSAGKSHMTWLLLQNKRYMNDMFKLTGKEKHSRIGGGAINLRPPLVSLGYFSIFRKENKALNIYTSLANLAPLPTQIGSVHWIPHLKRRHKHLEDSMNIAKDLLAVNFRTRYCRKYGRLGQKYFSTSFTILLEKRDYPAWYTWVPVCFWKTWCHAPTYSNWSYFISILFHALRHSLTLCMWLYAYGCIFMQWPKCLKVRNW